MSKPQTVSIKDITEDQIQKAFEKTFEQFEPIQGVRLVRITEEYYEKAANLCRDHFLPNEPLSKSIELSWNEIIEAYWFDTLKLNLSLMFIDEKTDEAVAFRTIKYAFKDEKLEFDVELPDELQILIDFTEYCDKQARFFDHYGVTEAFHFFSLVVAPKYQRRGYATKIFHAAIDFVQNLGFDDVYIKGEGSSNFSKKIYEKEGYEALYEHLYDQWEVKGKKPFLNTGEHKSIKLYGKRISLK